MTEVDSAARAVAEAIGGRFTAKTASRWRALFAASASLTVADIAAVVGCNRSTVVEARRRVDLGGEDERIRVETRSRRR